MSENTLSAFQTCGCDEEYGPCETHSVLEVLREGASLHTADELSLIFVLDVKALVGADFLDERDQADLARIEAALADERWLGESDDSDEYDAADALYDLVQAAESAASLGGYWVRWDDGFTIRRVTGGRFAE